MAILNYGNQLNASRQGALGGILQNAGQMQGLRNNEQIMQRQRDQDAATQQQAENKALLSKEAQEVFGRGDINEIAEFSIANKDLGLNILAARGLVGDAAKQRVSNRFANILTSANPQAALEREIALGEAENPPRDMTQSKEILAQGLDAEGIKQAAGMALASIDGQRFTDIQESFAGGTGTQGNTLDYNDFKLHVATVKGDPKLETVEGKAAAMALGLEPKAANTREERLARDKELSDLVAESESNIAGQKSAAVEEAKISPELKKQTQKLNMNRINELQTGEKQRASTIKKAQRFLKAFKGSQASGATRTALSFFPGTFTDQAQFDEAFNAFSEVAAREQLKASGETRPTDADVEGMKRAMFGVGRDEKTNVDLLSGFIEDLGDLDIELDELRDAKSRGGLSEFTGAPKFLSDADMLKKYGG